MKETTVTEQDILLLNVPDDQEMTTTFGEYRKLIRLKDKFERKNAALELTLLKVEKKFNDLALAQTILKRSLAHKEYKSNM